MNPMGAIAGWCLSLLLLVAGFALGHTYQPLEVIVEAVSIPMGTSGQLAGRVFLPARILPPYPVVVLCHGVSSTKEVMTPIATELARQGMAGFAFDFGGFGESYDRPIDDQANLVNLADIQAVVRFIRDRPERFDSKRLGIVGHSMGGAAALLFAEVDDDLQATAVLGMSGLANPILPPNLLLGIGLYEQFHSPVAMQQMLQAATGKEPREQQTIGDFATNRARRLAISPTADHLSEPYNPLLMREVVDWMGRSLAVPMTPLPLTMPGYLWGQLAGFAGSLGLGVGTAMQLRWRSRTWVLVGGLALLYILGVTGNLPATTASNGLLWGYAVLLVTNYEGRSPRPFACTLRVVALYAGLIFLAFAIATVLPRMGEWVARPSHILQLPVFLMQWLGALLHSRYQELRAGLFYQYSVSLQPSFLFATLILLEIIAPGAWLSFLEKVTVRSIFWLRQPLELDIFGASRRSLLLLGAAILIFAGILYQRSQIGLLAPEVIGGTLPLLGKFVLLPGVIFLLVVRQSWFQALER